MADKKEILDEMLRVINGGTKEENEEMYQYISRKFPEFTFYLTIKMFPIRFTGFCRRGKN